MSKNKSTKLAVLSLLGLLGLTACGATTDEVYSKPGDYESPIFSIDDSEEEIHHNVLSIIYDAMHEGSLSSKVLDKALYNYAESILGVYNKTTAKGREEITLKAAYTAYKYQDEAGNVTINAFIKKHKAYWLLNEEGEHIDEEGNVITGDDWTPCDQEREKVVAKWDAIERRIAENMYSRGLSGSYTEKHYFREAKFVRSLHEAGEKVNNAAAQAEQPKIVKYTVEKKDVFEENVLHREYYQDSASALNDNTVGVYTFVEDKVLPEVYNDLLIEQYLLDEDVAAIRNSRARKINVIKIEKYSSFTNNADMLVKKLVDEIYTTKPAAEDDHVRTDVEEIEEASKALFEKYGTIAKGLYNDIHAESSYEAIVNALNAKASDVYEKVTKTIGGTEYVYYKNTTYGDLVEEYEKLTEAATWDELDKTLYNSYTSNGTRSLKEGFEQQVIDIQQKENITKGWYIQNHAPSLDSNGTINDRLFKLSVSNAKVEVGKVEDGVEPEVRAEAIEELDATDRFEKKNGTWSLREKWSDTENKFLCSINGAYYLKFEGQYAGDDKRNDIVYDDGNAYYVVQVLEAAKDVKLRNTSETNYTHTRGQKFMDEVIDEVAKILGETGNYATVSRNHWLEKMDIVYHDQEVYDYFKDNYPDLFK